MCSTSLCKIMLLLASVHTGGVAQVQGSTCGQGSLYCCLCNCKDLSLLPKKDLLIYFSCCFLKLHSSLGCLGTRWKQGLMFCSHSFYVTLQIEKGPPNVCVQHTGPGCMSPLASPIPISTKSSCMVLPTPSTVVGMEPVGIA